ncbi:MAG: AraC family transcriptional regulator, partial [Bacteroidota bacterium]
MSIIKAYRHVHPQNYTLSFDIKRMEDIYDMTKGKADTPHRHDYYTIVLVKKASGKHILDFQEFELAAQQVYFVSPGQVHQIVEMSRSVGFALTFSPQFMVENGIAHNFIEDLHLFQDFGYTPPLILEAEDSAHLLQLAEEMLVFTHSDRKFKYQAVGALLKLFLIHCNNACALNQEENTQRVQASVALLRSFKALLNEHFKTWHKVADYANNLHITPDYLNHAVKSLTGKGAKEHIQSRILIAAKRLLRFSELQNKEIAYELGFSAPANFSQFFKKCTGVS